MSDSLRARWRTVFLLPFHYVQDRARQGLRRPVVDPAAQDHCRNALVETLLARGEPWKWERSIARDGKRLAYHRAYLHPFVERNLRDATRLHLRRAGDHELPFGELGEVGFEPGAPTTGVPLRVPDTAPAGNRLMGVELALFDLGIGVLQIRVDGEGSFDALIGLLEGFRQTARSFEGQSLPRNYQLAEGAPRDLLPSSMDDPGPWTNQLVRELLGDCDVLHLGDSGDKRMFVLAWAALSGRGNRGEAWRRLLYVDQRAGGSFGDDPKFAAEMAERHEYRRWWPDTRIGMTRYSMAFMGEDRPGGFFVSQAPKHVMQSYRSVVEVMLVSRACLGAYLDEAHWIAAQLQDTRGSRVVAEEAEVLKLAVLRYSARWWPSEFSHQDQGIDLARQLAQVMELPRLHADVNAELDRFAGWLDTRRERETAGLYTALGATFAVSGVLATALSVSRPEWPFALGFVLVSALASGLLWKVTRRRLL